MKDELDPKDPRSYVENAAAYNNTCQGEDTCLPLMALNSKSVTQSAASSIAIPKPAFKAGASLA